MKNNYQNKIRKDKCVNCGLCYSICPFMAIDEENRINTNKCSDCRLCLKVCPKKEKENFQKDFDYYICKNQNKKIHGSSGGIITSILINLLNKNIIDGCILTIQERGLKTKTIIAKTEEEIIKAAGSKYISTPTNKILRNLVNYSEKKLAYIGLPCQIEGVKNAQKIGHIGAKKIKFCLGLFCNHMPDKGSLNYINYFFKPPINSIKFREGPWPGEVIVNNQEKIPWPLFWSKGFGKYFKSKGCNQCKDGFAKFSDISFGDAWKINKKGFNSIIIIKTALGKGIINSVEDSDLIFNKISPEKFLGSQEEFLKSKISNKVNINIKNKLLIYLIAKYAKLRIKFI